MLITSYVERHKANNFNTERIPYKLPKTIQAYRKTIYKGVNAKANKHMQIFNTTSK